MGNESKEATDTYKLKLVVAKPVAASVVGLNPVIH
jgi:hypothetical protein